MEIEIRISKSKIYEIIYILAFVLVGFVAFRIFNKSPDDDKVKIILMDSGVNVSPEISPFLCKYGHQSFILGENDPFKDLTGHGTMMARVIVETLDPKKQCIVVFKSFKEKTPQYYAMALLEASKSENAVIVLAMEDGSYYFNEVIWYKDLTKYNKVLVAAGNDGKDLSRKCDVYPACLASEIKSQNFLVVGDEQRSFNHYGPVNARFPSSATFKNQKFNGTSVSTARAAGHYAKLMTINN